jgi:putative membrane protein
MYPSVLLASLHHLTAFTVVAMLAVEVALFKPPLSAPQARRLQLVDLMFGVSAAVLLSVGLIRVTWFEKGPAYYWHDLFFLIKFSAFIIAALISIYPTAVILSWTRTVKSGQAPVISETTTKRVRMCLMLELTAIVVILPCAALMARGFGFLLPPGG